MGLRGPALEKQTPAASAYHAVLSERAIKWLRVSTRGDTFTSTTKAVDIRRPCDSGRALRRARENAETSAL